MSKAVRADLAEYLCGQTRCSRRRADHIASLTVSWLAGQIAAGNRLELRGQGVFSLVQSKGRKSNLPKTNAVARQHLKVKFKPGRELKRSLAGAAPV
jgi:nucleoid DNA-binding protein